MLTRLSAGGLLLASLFLSACSDDPQSTDADTAPAYDQAQGKRVVSHYADVALATFGDALSGARALKTQIDALLAAPTEANLAAARVEDRSRPKHIVVLWGTATAQSRNPRADSPV